MTADILSSLLYASTPQQASTNGYSMSNNYKSINNSTHWFFIADHSIKDDNVWMFELSHDGCLLEELHFIHVFRASFQSLQSNLQICPAFPCTSFNFTKLTRSKVATYPSLQNYCISIFSQVCKLAIIGFCCIV